MQSRTPHSSTRFRRQLLCCFFLLLFTSSASRAQTIYGSVLGHVVDSTGAAVSGAKVTLTSLKTAEQRTTTTDSRGGYQFVSLPLDSYQLEIASPGLKQLTRSSIDVTVGSVVRIDAALVVGGTSDSIAVHAETPLLQTEQSSLGQVIEGKQIQNIPLNGRNVMNLVALVPGVIPQGGTQGSTAGNYAASGDFTNVAGFGNYQIGGGLVRHFIYSVTYFKLPLQEVGPICLEVWRGPVV